jgi:antitoxin component YwqK of YwqJK toxin-antitoxin module
LTRYDILNLDGDRTYIGTTREGKREGHGITYFKSSGQKVFEGQYMNDRLHGFGKLYRDSCNNHPIIQFVGYFSEGSAHGNGISYHKNGKMKYRGLWKTAILDRVSFNVEMQENGALVGYNLNGDSEVSEVSGSESLDETVENTENADF